MLKIDDLTLHYGHSQILNGISMQAELGKVTCVMGTNGVGKTSLMRAISGTHRRSGGAVSLDGETLAPLPAHVMAQKGVAYVPQGREIFPLLTVRENLETGYSCLPASEHFVPDEIFELFPILKEFLNRRGGGPVGRATTAACHRTGADFQAQAVVIGRADRGHSAQHHPTDRPRDRTSARPWRYGDCAGRAVL